MLSVKVTDLETLDTDQIDRKNISFLVCVNLDVIDN